MLVQIDGTPFDWFGNDQRFTLHMAVDDTTNDILAGWFTKNECMYEYCKMMELLIKKKRNSLSYLFRQTYYLQKS